ncbi:MAG: hypothetical protein HFI93_09060 [Lachnospiraceae bacterium]|nr:hypothetical protein [Lachnospiraceae bacterium]
MNPEETLKTTELDSRVGNPRLQMLKASLPYLPPEGQRFAAILTKWFEFQTTLRLFDNPEEILSICEVKEPPPGPFGVLDEIKKYGSPEDRSQIEFAKNFVQAMNLYRQMEAMQKENEPEKEEEDKLETQSWNNDPSLRQMDPKKLSLLMDMAKNVNGQTPDTLMSFLMSLMAKSGEQGLNFTDAETDLILKVLRQHMSPEEQGRIDMIRQMVRMMENNRKSEK